MPKFDMKSLLLLSGSPVFKAVRLTPRALALPSLAIYPTTRCNYHCQFCWLTTATEKITEVMDFDLLSRLLDEASRMLVKPKVHFSGYGEPLVYPHMRDTMRLCHEKGLRWSMTTNGYLLDKYAEDIVRYGCSGVNLSVHGTPELHDQTVMVKNAFKKGVEGLQKLDQVKQANGKASPPVAINCVITNDNIHMLREVMETFLSLPASSITFQHLSVLEHELEKDAAFLVLDREKLETLIQFKQEVESASLPKRVNFFPRLSNEAIYRFYMEREYRPRANCVMPWLTARVFPNGDVSQCGVAYGNLNEHSIMELMNGEAALKFRRAIKSGAYYSAVCYRCCHQAYEK